MKQYADGTYKELSELTPKDEGQKILITGMVIGQGEVEHYAESIMTVCSNCKKDSYWLQENIEDDWRDPVLIRKCDRCNLTMIEDVQKKNMLKKIIISEQGVDNPLFITGFIYGENINKIQPGRVIKAEGILRSRKYKQTDMTYKKHFDIIQFGLADEKVIMPSKEEIKEFEELDKTELIRSFAPHIKNMYLIKEGLLLSCLGGVEATGFRADINTLMLGDPGTAKTQLLNFAVTINQKSDYASGNSASGAGLFGGIERTPDGTHYAKAGVAVMCNGGILALDEMEKMNPQDRVYAHEVMESQTFTLRKIVPVKWQVKISILGAANPKKSRWNSDLTISENVNMPDSLISRFGLIFLVRDIANKSEDLAIAEHLEKTLLGEIEETLPVEKMMKFISYARSLKPKSTKEGTERIKYWWSELRDVEQMEGAIAVDVRTLYDIHRLAQAYAKLDLSETVEVRHAERAIKMLNDSLHTLGMNTPGEKNQSIMKHMDKMEFVRYIFREPVTMEVAVTRMCEKNKWFPSEESAKVEIENLNKTHSLLEVGDKLKWV